MNFKKNILLLVAVFMILFPTISNATNYVYLRKEKIELEKQRKITLIINDKEIKPDVEPFIYNGRTYVPVRAIAEELGMEVDWREHEFWEETIEVILSQSNGRKINIDLVDVKADGISFAAGTPTEEPGYLIKEDRTFLPIRYIANALHMDVYWNPETYTIKLVSSNEREVIPVYFDITKENGLIRRERLINIEWRDGKYLIEGQDTTVQDVASEIFENLEMNKIKYNDLTGIIKEIYFNNRFHMDPYRKEIFAYPAS